MNSKEAIRLLKLNYELGMTGEIISSVAKEIDAFLLDCYKEFFNKDYKKGDSIPGNMQEKWADFVRSKFSEL